MAEVSVYLVTGMGLERQKAIISPLVSRADYSLTFTRLSIAAAWCIPVLIAFYNSVLLLEHAPKNPTIGQYCKARRVTNLTGSMVIYSTVFIGNYLIPLLILLHTSVRIWRHLLNEKPLRLRMITSGSSNQERIMKERKRIYRTLFLVVLSFFISWTPYRVSMFLAVYQSEKYQWNSATFQAFVLMGFSSSFINCFLYSFQSTEFRKHFHEVFPSPYLRISALRKRMEHYRQRRGNKDSEQNPFFTKQNGYSTLPTMP